MCHAQANGDTGGGKKQLPAALRARLLARGILKVPAVLHCTTKRVSHRCSAGCMPVIWPLPAIWLLYVIPFWQDGAGIKSDV